MGLRRVGVLLLMTALAIGARAETITGTILIKKRLTRPSVTPAISVYQRGTMVQLGSDPDEDPLVLERSRVVLYVDGPAAAPVSLAPSDSFQIKQMDRRFLPDLVVVPVGSTVSFPNMDPIFHNIFSLSCQVI